MKRFSQKASTTVNTKDKLPQKSSTGPTNNTEKKKYSFEEFKLYYESTEKVTDRRINNNNLNYSICIAILLAIGYLWDWSFNHMVYYYISITLIIIISVIASAYAQLWLAQIRDFKRLNTAKFAVLDEMASNIAFSDQQPEGNMISYAPFQKEWEKIKNLNGLQQRSRFNIIALRSSNQEYFMPQAFTVVFVIMGFTPIITIILHFNLFIESWKHFLKI